MAEQEDMDSGRVLASEPPVEDVQADANLASKTQELSLSESLEKPGFVQRVYNSARAVIDERVDDTKKAINEKVVLYYSSFNLSSAEWASRFERLQTLKVILRERLGAAWDLAVESWTPFTSDKFMQPAKAFYTASLDLWLTLDADRDGKVSWQEFLEGLKCKLGSAWSDRLVGPAEAFYQTAMHEWQALKQQEDGKVTLQDLRTGICTKLIHPVYDKGVHYVRTHIVEPLLVATERAVEYILPEDSAMETEQQSLQAPGHMASQLPPMSLEAQAHPLHISSSSSSSSSFLPQAGGEMVDPCVSEPSQQGCGMRRVPSIEEIKDKVSTRLRRRAKRTFTQLKRLSSSSAESMLNKEVIDTAVDYVDGVTKRLRANYTVTSNFVTNIVEINSAALQRMGTAYQAGSEAVKHRLVQPAVDAVNIRFIQPARTFYSAAMDQWLRLDVNNDGKVTLQDFVESMREALGSAWNDRLMQPTETFYQAVKEEWELTKAQGQGKVSFHDFFERVKEKLLVTWQENIVRKTALFKSASKDQSEGRLVDDSLAASPQYPLKPTPFVTPNPIAMDMTQCSVSNMELS